MNLPKSKFTVYLLILYRTSNEPFQERSDDSTPNDMFKNEGRNGTMVLIRKSTIARVCLGVLVFFLSRNTIVD